MQLRSWINAAVLVLVLSSCGNMAKDDKAGVNSKKAELEKLKKERSNLDDRIEKLNKEIALIDPDFGIKPVLVGVTSLTARPFEHFIDLQGRVDADNISYVAPRGAPGQVRAVYIKKGDYVKNGQLLLKLEDATLLKQMEGLKTQLAYANDIYTRTKNLWDQGIGTEVQLKTAENNVKSLNDQISTLSVAIDMTNVRAEVNGYVETMDVRVGEIFNGGSIVIVNPSSLKVVTSVPENYVSKISKGTPVKVSIPDLKLDFNSSISLVSREIGLNSRSVVTEAKIPSSSTVRINQMAAVRIKDYGNPSALVIPLTVLQTDEKGKYVFVLADENGKKTARKKAVTVGEIYGEEIEVTSGLSEGDRLITEGFQGLYEGRVVTTGIN